MKEIKLIKVGEHYDLYHRIAEENLIIGFASTDNTFVNKLSLENCQKIENGYNLDELVEQNWRIGLEECIPTPATHVTSFKAGFQKALEILGDKKYTEENIEEAFAFGQLNQLHDLRYFSGSKAYVQLLQQKKWDCIVEMEKVKDETKIIGSVKGVKGSGDKITTYKSIPKLDADGCLILKRKI